MSTDTPSSFDLNSPLLEDSAEELHDSIIFPKIIIPIKLVFIVSGLIVVANIMKKTGCIAWKYVNMSKKVGIH